MPPKRKRSSTSSETSIQKGKSPGPLNDDWQNQQGTLPKCLMHMLNTEDQPSVTFVVGEEKEKIKAHKLILAARSPVFYSMFYGPLAQQEDEITLVDIQPEGFKRLLRFV